MKYIIHVQYIFFFTRINAVPFSPGRKYAYKFYILEREREGERERERERLLSSNFTYNYTLYTLNSVTLYRKYEFDISIPVINISVSLDERRIYKVNGLCKCHYS